MFLALRTAVSKRFELLAELAGLALSVTLGFFPRLSGRRNKQPVELPATRLWARSVAALLSVVEVAVLVEATDIPVRFHQPGFSYLHWALAVAAFSVAYLVQLQVLRLFPGRRNEASAP